MFQPIVENSFKECGRHFAWLEVNFPEEGQWTVESFNKLRDEELAIIKEGASSYDRKERFGEDPWFRYFKKYKKTYPVLMQMESFLLKDRPFPTFNPLNEVVFLCELKTGKLMGAHDIDKMAGDVHLYCPVEKTPFVGLGNRDCHVYPGDTSAFDDEGIILSMIGGADNRTCISEASRNIAYLCFGAEGVGEEVLIETLKQLETYVKALAPTATAEMKVV